MITGSMSETDSNGVRHSLRMTQAGSHGIPSITVFMCQYGAHATLKQVSELTQLSEGTTPCILNNFRAELTVAV
jgi:hypothetical protein